MPTHYGARSEARYKKASQLCKRGESESKSSRNKVGLRCRNYVNAFNTYCSSVMSERSSIKRPTLEQKIPAGLFTAEKQLTVLLEAFVSISYLAAATAGRSSLGFFLVLFLFFFHAARQHPTTTLWNRMSERAKNSPSDE